MSANMFRIAKVHVENKEEIYYHRTLLRIFYNTDTEGLQEAQFILHLHLKILSWINNRNHRFPNYIDELSTQYDRCQVCKSNVTLNKFIITDDEEEEQTVTIYNDLLGEQRGAGRIDTLGNLDFVCHACISCRELVGRGIGQTHISINSYNVESVDDEVVNVITVSLLQHPQKQYFVTHLGILNRICLIESSLDDEDEDYEMKRFHETEEQKYSYYVDGFDNFGDKPYFIEKKIVHQYFTMRQIKHEAETDFVSVLKPAYILK